MLQIVVVLASRLQRWPSFTATPLPRYSGALVQHSRLRSDRPRQSVGDVNPRSSMTCWVRRGPSPTRSRRLQAQRLQLRSNTFIRVAARDSSRFRRSSTTSPSVRHRIATSGPSPVRFRGWVRSASSLGMPTMLCAYASGLPVGRTNRRRLGRTRAPDGDHGDARMRNRRRAHLRGSGGGEEEWLVRTHIRRRVHAVRVRDESTVVCTITLREGCDPKYRTWTTQIDCYRNPDCVDKSIGDAQCAALIHACCPIFVDSGVW